MSVPRAWVWFAVIVCSFSVFAGSGTERTSVVVGKNPGDVKGRWLEIYDPAVLERYDEAFVDEITVEIAWKKEAKDTPIDEKILKDRIREHLVQDLTAAGVFRQVGKANPGEARPGFLRLDCELVVEPGSRTMRYLVGMGAGKSKSILEIRLRDAQTGEEIGLYHGFGTGSGMGFKLAGGGAAKMTEDDIQENSKKFAELLASVRR